MKYKEEIISDKVSIEDLQKIWNDEQRQYTDEELQKIRNWLYAMAEVVVEVSKGRRVENEIKKMDKKQRE